MSSLPRDTAALAEPDLERYTIRLPVGDIRSVHKACMMRGRGSQVRIHA
jgi:hypothetical protein